MPEERVRRKSRVVEALEKQIEEEKKRDAEDDNPLSGFEKVMGLLKGKDKDG